MKEVKYSDQTVIETRTVTKYMVATRLPSGGVIFDGILYQSYADAKRITEGMTDYQMRHGNEESAREREASAYCIYPVEVPEPVIDWNAAEEVYADGKREVA